MGIQSASLKRDPAWFIAWLNSLTSFTHFSVAWDLNACCRSYPPELASCQEVYGIIRISPDSVTGAAFCLFFFLPFKDAGDCRSQSWYFAHGKVPGLVITQ